MQRYSNMRYRVEQLRLSEPAQVLNWHNVGTIGSQLVRTVTTGLLESESVTMTDKDNDRHYYNILLLYLLDVAVTVAVTLWIWRLRFTKMMYHNYDALVDNTNTIRYRHPMTQQYTIKYVAASRL